MNYKMRVSSPEESASVQDVCFRNGIVWANDDNFIQNTDKEYLYVRDNKITYGYRESWHIRQSIQEITPSEFIALFEPQKAPHADLIMQYAKDAQETAKPWEQWEWSDNSKDWMQCKTHPMWNPENRYRKKPAKIKASKYEFAKPFTTSPGIGTEYYFVVFSSHSKHQYKAVAVSDKWLNKDADFERMEGNRCHLLKRDAEQHAAAINALSIGEL